MPPVKEQPSTWVRARPAGYRSVREGLEIVEVQSQEWLCHGGVVGR